MRFIDRQFELATLDRFYAYHRAAMMFISGQLRTGKTTLLSHWLRRRDVADALFWTVPSLDAASQLRDFLQALAQFDPCVQYRLPSSIHLLTGKRPLSACGLSRVSQTGS